MKNLPLSLALSAAVAVFGLTIPAYAADLKAVLAKPQQREQAADFRVTGRLVRVDANGTRTSRAITLKAHWFSGVLRVVCEIASPAEARMHILLEMRPNGQTTIQIAKPGDKTPTVLPFERWTEGPLGTGFSYEDLLEAQYFWSGQMLLPEAKYGARECDVLKSTPGPADRTHYAEIRSWLDKTIGYPVYVEKTRKDSGIVKEFTYLGLRQNEGEWSAGQVEVKTRGETGSTLLIVDRGAAHANLELKDFSPEQLTHF